MFVCHSIRNVNFIFIGFVFFFGVIFVFFQEKKWFIFVFWLKKFNFFNSFIFTVIRTRFCFATLFYIFFVIQVRQGKITPLSIRFNPRSSLLFHKKKKLFSKEEYCDFFLLLIFFCFQLLSRILSFHIVFRFLLLSIFFLDDRKFTLWISISSLLS